MALAESRSCIRYFTTTNRSDRPHSNHLRRPINWPEVLLLYHSRAINIRAMTPNDRLVGAIELGEILRSAHIHLSRSLIDSTTSTTIKSRESSTNGFAIYVKTCPNEPHGGILTNNFSALPILSQLFIAKLFALRYL